MRHINICIVLSILIALLFINNVSALTAAIQNCKVVIYPTVGESTENCIKVINRNDEQIRIEISAEGDIKDDFKFLENNITLEAGEEKKVYYDVKPAKAGTTEMNIIVKFIPEEGNGIILPAKLTVIASGENSGDDSNNDISDDNTDNNSNDDADNNTNNVNVNFGGNDNSNSNNNDETDRKLSPYVPLIIIGGILLIILIILIVIGGKPKQAQENKPIEPKNQNNLYNENKSVKSDKIDKKKRLKEPRE